MVSGPLVAMAKKKYLIMMLVVHVSEYGRCLSKVLFEMHSMRYAHYAVGELIWFLFSLILIVIYRLWLVAQMRRVSALNGILPLF